MENILAVLAGVGSWNLKDSRIKRYIRRIASIKQSPHLFRID